MYASLNANTAPDGLAKRQICVFIFAATPANDRTNAPNAMQHSFKRVASVHIDAMCIRPKILIKQ
jgi:hypothetical protein